MATPRPLDPPEPERDAGGKRWREALAIYRDRRMLAIVGQGFSSGLPMPLTTTTLAYWLARDGVDLTTIGLFSLFGLPYSLKFLWAPVLDHWSVPGLASLGLRRSWMIFLQAGLVAAIAGLGFVDPRSAPVATGAIVFAIAFFSASQDVAVDAYRIEILGDREQGAGAAATQAGYRAGLLASGAGALALADFADWRLVYAVLAGAMAFAMLAVVLAREPERVKRVERSPARALLTPLLDVVRWERWPLVLAFALLFKLGDSVAGTMTSPFFVALGFSGVEIASITKVVGLVASVVGIVVGGILVARTSIRPALVVGGVLQASTNLFYVWLAHAGHDRSVLALAIVADQFTGGVASAAFVAYFSQLCRGAWSGSQYALLTSLMRAGGIVVSGASGWLAGWLGWGTFFAGTAALAIPGLLLLAVLPDPNRSATRRESRSPTSG